MRQCARGGHGFDGRGVAETPLAAPLVSALRALIAWLDASTVRGVVIGGVAASLLGRPRVTGDIGALVLVAGDDWDAFVAKGARFAIYPRRADVIAFARRTRVLLLRHDPTGIDLDVSVAALPFEYDIVTRGRRRRIAGLSVPMITPEDLIVMKAIAHRPRDIADIEGLRDVHPRLDRARIVRLVREFATILEAPELVRDLERILGPSQSRKRVARRKTSRRRR